MIKSTSRAVALAEDARKSSLPNTGPEQWQEVIMKVMRKGTDNQNILYTCVEIP